MKTYLMIALTTLLSPAAFGSNDATSPAADTTNTPASPIVKIGTIDEDQGETAPVVFDDVLYRLEAIHIEYHGNETGAPYFRLINVATGEAGPSFAHGHSLGSAYVEDGTMYIIGTPGWGASKINMFVSTDLIHWEKHEVVDLPGWEIFNTSVCKAGDRYVMAFEVGAPAEVAGVRFTSRFLESTDMYEWALLPEPAVHTKEKYSACPTIRWSDGWFYMTYLNAIGGYQFETNMVRSQDLAIWEESPRNPVITFDDRDKTIASDRLSGSQIAQIRGALNTNASDIDYIEFEGQVIIYYSWGDQRTYGCLVKAYYDGTLDEFHHYYFPEDDTAP